MWRTVILMMWVGVCGAAELPRDDAAGHAPGYSVDCQEGVTDARQCKVDAQTLLGWRAFHTHCAQCHGGSGLGSTFAPNLQERFNTRVDFARFSYVLQHGYHGQMGVMPNFAQNKAVLAARDALYAYLSARAKGALPPGRPQGQ